jgi:hypothetical protein
VANYEDALKLLHEVNKLVYYERHIIAKELEKYMDLERTETVKVISFYYNRNIGNFYFSYKRDPFLARTGDFEHFNVVRASRPIRFNELQAILNNIINSVILNER